MYHSYNLLYLLVLSRPNPKNWNTGVVQSLTSMKVSYYEVSCSAKVGHIECQNFGGKINGEVFEAIAKSISIKILAKHKNRLQQIEALLLGQAGLLNADFTDPYPVMLQKEYRFLKIKYNSSEVDFTKMGNRIGKNTRRLHLLVRILRTMDALPLPGLVSRPVSAILA